jgi:hypothetical protein
MPLNDCQRIMTHSGSQRRRLFRFSLRAVEDILKANFTLCIQTQRHFNTWSEARAAAKKAEVIGLIHFAFNFTESFVPLKYWTEFDEFDNNGAIEVHLDMTDLNTVTNIQRNIYSAYQRFIKKLMIDCERSEKSWNLPVIFETFNGDLEDEFTNAISPGFLFA